jgi:hypothetical protein
MLYAEIAGRKILAPPPGISLVREKQSNLSKLCPKANIVFLLYSTLQYSSAEVNCCLSTFLMCFYIIWS